MKLDLQLFSSASVQTSSYSGRYLKLTVTEESYSVAGNTSTVRWTLESIGGNSRVSIYNCSVVVNGQVVFNSGHTSYTQNVFPTTQGSTTGTIIVGHDATGYAPDVSFTLHGKVYYNGDENRSGSISLTRIPRYATMTGATDFNDEQNPTITFSNPASSSLSVWLEPNPNGDHLCIRESIPSTGSYTWSLTDNERKQLRSKCTTSNSCTIRLGMYTTIGNNTQATYMDKTFSIINANPTFSSFTFEDTNEKTIALTGNNQDIIIGYSNVKATIPSTSKGTALKEATMKKYRLTVGNQSKDVIYSDTEDVSISIDNVQSGTFTMYAIDSRNNSTPVYKNANNIINYEPIKITYLNLSRESGVSGKVTLSLSGTFWNGNFGTKSNSLKGITYNIHNNSTNTDTKGTTTITPTITEGKNEFSFNGVIAGDEEDTSFNVSSSYVITLSVNDELSNTSQSYTLGTGIPAISIDRNGVGIFCKYDSSIGGYLQVNGSNIMSATTLFEGAAKGDITLSDSAANYEYLELYYYDNDSHFYSAKFGDPNGRTIAITGVSMSNAMGFLRLKVYEVSGKNILANQEAEAVTSASNNIAYDTTGYFAVYKVVGYK